MGLYRGREDKPFDKAVAEALRSVIRYLAIGLAVSESPSPPTEDAAVVAEEDLGIGCFTGAVITGAGGVAPVIAACGLDRGFSAPCAEGTRSR